MSNEETTLVVHEKMRKHFTPLNGHILIEYVRNLKTSAGIYIPEASQETKAIAHPIVALSPGDPAISNSILNNLVPGDWISLRSMQVDVFKMYDRDWAIVRDFDVMLKVDMNYIMDEKEYKENSTQIAFK